MFLFKAVASILTKPLLIATCVLLISVVMRVAGRRRLAGILAFTAGAIVYTGALSLVADELLGPLERRYPPLTADEDVRDAAFVVVLGSGYSPRPNVPITASIDGEGLARIVEAIRLARRYHITLIASGGAGDGGVPSALGYALLAHDLGIETNSLLVSASGTDTDSESLAIARLVNGKPFILVTSAAHMPRAMTLLQRRGAKPTAAPTAQRSFRSDSPGIRRWLPSSQALRGTEIALHEYFGLLALRLGWV